MRIRTLFFVAVALTGAQACGSPSGNDFEARNGAGASSGQGTSGGKGGSSTGGKGGSSGTSGTGGKGGSGTGGTASGGTSSGGDAGNTTGGTAGDVATGGTAGDVATGGTAGDVAAGGTGNTGTGGDAGNTTGGTTGNTGGTAGAGGKGGSGGSAGQPNCAELEQQYATALATALACNADSGKDQCTKSVRSDLTCGCNVYVNPDNKEAVAKLDMLAKQAGTGCARVCPAIACVIAEAGTCQPAATGGDPGGICVTPVGVAL